MSRLSEDKFPYECDYVSIWIVSGCLLDFDEPFKMNRWIMEYVDQGNYEFTAPGAKFKYKDDLIAFKIRFGI